MHSAHSRKPRFLRSCIPLCGYQKHMEPAGDLRSAPSYLSEVTTSTLNTVRTLVSQEKVRFVNDGFDLDLSCTPPPQRLVGWGSRSSSLPLPSNRHHKQHYRYAPTGAVAGAVLDTRDRSILTRFLSLLGSSHGLPCRETH